jgi:hypothetical protein
VRRADLDDIGVHEPGDEVRLYWRARHSYVIGAGDPAAWLAA